MTTPVFDNWPEAVKYDRTQRHKMTRAEYAELTKLTPGLVQGAENGRKMKKETIEKLLVVMADLLPEQLGGTAGAENTATMPQPAPRDPIEGIDSLAEHERVRAWLIGRFERVQDHLAGKPAPPIGTPGNGQTTPADCPASEFQAWASWIDELEQHLGFGPMDVPETPGGDWVPVDLDGPDGSELIVWTLPGDIAPAEQWSPGQIYAGDSTVMPAVPPVVEGGAFTDLEMQLAASVERARNGGQPDVASAMAVSSTPDGQREDMEHPVRAERLGRVVQGPWEALNPPQPGRRQPDKLKLDPQLIYITNSALQTFSDCKRRWWLEHYKKLSAGPRSVVGAAPLGTRVHQALSVFYVPEGETAGDPLAELAWTVADDQRYLESQNASAVKIRELEAEHDFARIIVEGYLEWVEESGADRDYQVISTEHGLVANPGFEGLPNVRLLSKEDTRLLRNIDGAVLFIDHKVVQNFEQLVSWAHMNRQMIHYGLIEFLILAERQFQQTGMDVDEREMRTTDGAILNMLRKIKRTATAKPPFYHRHQIRFNKDTFRSYWRQVFGTVKEMIEVGAKLDAGGDHQELCPPRPTQDCSWKCQFFVQCSLFDDGSDIDRLISETFVEVNPLQRYDRELSRFVE